MSRELLHCEICFSAKLLNAVSLTQVATSDGRHWRKRKGSCNVWTRRPTFAELELVENCRLSCCIKTDHEDSHLFLPELPKKVTFETQEGRS